MTCPRAHAGHGRQESAASEGASLVIFPRGQALALNVLQEDVHDLNLYQPESQVGKVEMRMGQVSRL